MKIWSLASRVTFLSLGLLLAGCGGGGVTSTPAPIPAPTPSPTPTNASLSALTVSQSFSNNAAIQTAVFDLTNSNTVSGSSASAPLTIAYDAGSGSYTVSTQGRSQSFLPADISTSGQGQALFVKTDAANNRDRLTLWAPSYGGSGPQHVGMGMWQRNSTSGTRQNTTLDMFAYGLPSAASAVPRVGTAAFNAFASGLTTRPGFEPRSFSGNGRFDADFQTGIFNTYIPVTETELVSTAGTSGGSLQIIASGPLSFGDGTFSGTASYGGFRGTSQGTITGRFYGPNANEIGAAFTTTGSDGSSATGAIVGQKNVILAPINLALTNIVAEQLYSTAVASVNRVRGGELAATGMSNGQFTTRMDGSFGITGPGSPGAHGRIAAIDQIQPSGPNFTTYRKVLDEYTVTLNIYKAGSANGEIALTYASFVHRNQTIAPNNLPDQDNIYELFGFITDRGAVQARNGRAHYAGVARGTAIDTSVNQIFAVSGTSVFDVDFAASSLTGSLALKGNAGVIARDFGNFTFSTNIFNGFPVIGNLVQTGNSVGTIAPRFFGPNAEEIGAAFRIDMAIGQNGQGISIAGVALGKPP